MRRWEKVPHDPDVYKRQIVVGFVLDFVLRGVLPKSLRGGYTGHADEVDCHEEHSDEEGKLSLIHIYAAHPQRNAGTVRLSHLLLGKGHRGRGRGGVCHGYPCLLYTSCTAPSGDTTEGENHHGRKEPAAPSAPQPGKIGRAHV